MQECSCVVPLPVNSFERFFVILLRSSVEEYASANACARASLALWRVLCQRANLPVPTERIRPHYRNAKMHFELRAALVLEEAREALSRGVVCHASAVARQQQPQMKIAVVSPAAATTTTTVVASPQPHQQQGACSLRARVEMSKARDHGITFVTFRKEPDDERHDGEETKKYFTDEEKQQLMPGQVMQCTCSTMMMVGTNGSASEAVLLGCILPCARERIHKSAEFDLLFFEKPTLAVLAGMIKKWSVWSMVPVHSMIGPCRQFAAMTQKPEKVPFLNALLGVEQYPLPDVRTASNMESSSVTVSVDKVVPEKTSNHESTRQHAFTIPSLNENQEKAVSTFLDSPPASISIVQGPPGTGKTSLLVATICRYLSSSRDTGGRRRLLVCAPTNKAVSVLATRFLAASSDLYGCTVNMVLVGDDDKLLESKRNCPLRPHFVYSWHAQVLQELKVIRQSLDTKKVRKKLTVQRRKDIVNKAVSIRRRIFNGLPTLPAYVKRMVDDLCTGLLERNCGNDSLYNLAKFAHTAVAKLPYEAWKSDLMGSADVIFCTLCSSASKVMELARPESIEALIVDEAAAATEPDLCIPFYLRPSRLLIVGDPKQLPSTVLSDRAKLLGLDVSLQERLMNHNRFEYIMLNIQYRMHPEISTFPSRRFYHGNVKDGGNVTTPMNVRGACLLGGRPYVFLQVNGVEQHGVAESMCNEMEALAVVGLVKRLEQSNDPAWHAVDRIRIITFYTAQVLLLRKKLADAGLDEVLVATVDSSQGCEADVVIISLVRSSSAGFLKDDRRVNVALTRARHQLVCVGNMSCFPSMADAYTLHELAGDARKRNAIVDRSPGMAVAKRFKSAQSTFHI